jgi:1-acyl-sn-glycerol-3-phosphate acyltransferase
MRDAWLYRFLRPIIKFLVLFIGPKYIGLENIPKEGAIILVGNHTSILDPLILISATNRSIHFLAKEELWHGLKKIIFNNMGLIPVNRKIKDHNALVMAEDYLKEGSVIGIFPEGTTEKGRGLLPFKIGSVKMAQDTNTKIVPFIINGKYRLLGRIRITFLEPISITGNLEEENNRLRNLIKNNITGSDKNE